jgi:DNA-binding Xre family transcriptional regulator
MNLNKNVVAYLEAQAEKRQWTSNAEWAKNIGFTEATWSRIRRLKQAIIKDTVADKICTAFGITPVDLLLISTGRPIDNVVMECPAPYHTKNPKLTWIINWLENDANESQIDAMVATAKAIGAPNESPSNLHSGREESPSAAGAA